MLETLTISKNRLKLVLEIYKRGVISLEEAEMLLLDDRPVSQINPDWLIPRSTDQVIVKPLSIPVNLEDIPDYNYNPNSLPPINIFCAE